MKQVAVLGGSGFVGRALCRQLSARGDWTVTVLTRKARNAASVAPLRNVNVLETPIETEGELQVALESVDAVVNLVAVLHGDAHRFRAVHVELPRRLGDVLRSVGGHIRLVHVSALGVCSHRPSLYLQSKADGEQVLRDLQPSCAVLRPSVIYGAEDKFLNTFERLQRFAPCVPLACSDALFQPVWVEDVASAIVACLEHEHASSGVFECAGPEVFSLKQLVELAGRRGGFHRPVLPLPLPLARAQAWLLEHLPGEPLMSRDNLASMQVPNLATPGRPGLHDLGITPRALGEFLAHSSTTSPPPPL